MFFAVTAQKRVFVAHCDTYGIALAPGKSIPDVSDAEASCIYPQTMGENTGSWLDWGKRLRAHVRENKDVSWAKIALELNLSESAVRHWCNSTRKVNLSDFFRLCAAAKADPAQMLFGRITITDDQRKRLGDLVVSVLESDPAVAPHYAPLITSIRRDYRAKGKRSDASKRPRSGR